MVQFDGILVVAKQAMANGVAAFAVLARNDVRIACIGCFKRDMLISDAAGCKKCASFVKHWDAKAGVQRLLCEPDGDAAKLEDAQAGRAAFVEASAAAELDNAAPDDMATAMELSAAHKTVQESLNEAMTLESLTDDELLEAVTARQLGEHVVMNMDDKAFAKAIDAKDFKSLIGARPSRLIHELRRQHTDSECETRCGDKKGDMPRCSDAVGADVTVTKEPVVVHGTRGAKRQKQLKASAEHVLFPPRAAGDCSWVKSSQIDAQTG